MSAELRVSFSRRILTAIIATAILGVVVTAAWLAASDLRELGEAARSLNWILLPLLPLLTLINLGLRFLRWTFFLRRIGAYVPLRDNLKIFLASFSMILTPLHCGEAFKAIWLRQRAGTPLRFSGSVLLTERLFDVMSLLLLAAFFSTEARSTALIFLAALLAISVLLSSRLGRFAVGYRTEDPEAPYRQRIRTAIANALRQLRPGSLIVGMGLSLTAWLAAAATLTVAVAMSGGPWSLEGTIVPFSIATPLGAITFVPGGVGVTGSLILHDLQTSLGLSLPHATVAVILTRGATFWFATAVGTWMLLGLVRRKIEEAREGQGDHFDDMAEHYEEEIPSHVRDHLLGKKIERMVRFLPEDRSHPGLDLGCGQGWYLQEMRSRGHKLIGFDYSRGQLQSGGVRGGAVADARHLPLPDDSISFSYCVNMLHHIIDRGGQDRALEEIVRVLRPGGRLFVHEINVTNPLFRFYMGYVFPLLNDIDLGNERWLYPLHMPEVKGARLIGVEYFTFLPDFIPRPLFRLLLPLERWLEKTRWKPLSAHYMAVYEKAPSETAPG